MTVQYMQNSIIRIFGFESDVSIMFLDYCKTHTEKEISSLTNKLSIAANTV